MEGSSAYNRFGTGSSMTRSAAWRNFLPQPSKNGDKGDFTQACRMVGHWGSCHVDGSSPRSRAQPWRSFQRPHRSSLRESPRITPRHFGDDPEDGGPIATDLSPSLKPDDVAKVMRKVADWQLARSEPYFDRIWTWSVLYSGFMAASDSLGDAKYSQAMDAMGRKFDWQLRSHPRRRGRPERRADLS